VQSGDRLRAGEPVELRGVAFDGGLGIREVQVSVNGGQTWASAALGKDLGNYSFREWTLPALKLPRGWHDLKARAFNRVGESQPLEAQWNPNGYLRNVVETVRVEVV
jgi:hypothetical protein